MARSGISNGIIGTACQEELTYSAKVFGSLTYDRKLSFPEEVGEYEVAGFSESKEVIRKII